MKGLINMNVTFKKLLNTIRDTLRADPQRSDIQVQQYQKMLRMNLREQDQCVRDLKEQAKKELAEQMKVRN